MYLDKCKNNNILSKLIINIKLCLNWILYLIACIICNTFIVYDKVLANENKEANHYQYQQDINNQIYSKSELNTIRLPKNKPIPGGIAIIPLDLNTIDPPKVLFNTKQVLVIDYNNSQNDKHIANRKAWIAIVGIPMETKSGLHSIFIFLDPLEDGTFGEQIEKSFLVAHAKYPTEKLKLPQKFISPSYGEQLRINQEQELIKKAYEYRSALIPNLVLSKPVDGRKTSPFGLKRILNGQHKGFHSGLDLAAPVGSKVVASSYGRVILIGDFFYTGYSVFVDHGNNLITSYSHLDSILVKEGDLVNSKTVIGTVGTTGRSTGPHLHWTVSLNNVRVNPELFLD